MSRPFDKRRHECEIRYILNMQNPSAMAEYMRLIEKARGKTAADKIRAEVRKILLDRRKTAQSGQSSMF